jgi:isopentenyl-diphosphate delta-isomerase
MALSGGSPRRSDTTHDRVILVDEHDRELGTISKLEAHVRGLRHRAVSVVLRDNRGRLLLQRRAAGKYHSAGLWTNTCCGHPRPGERPQEAALRRLADEMGLGCELTFLFAMHYEAAVSDGLVENEIVHVFTGRCDAEPRPNPDEVAEWRWQAPEDVASDIDAWPEHYTPWFAKLRREFWDRLTAPF